MTSSMINGNISAILANQNQIIDIMNAENSRLDEKTQTYQNLEFGHKRVLQLNQNFQKRTEAFNWILVVLFLTLAVAVFILFFNKIFPGLQSIFTILLIVVLSLGFCHSVYLYVVFMNRSPSNYDEIQYQQNSTDVTRAPKTTPIPTLSSVTTTTTMPVCIGQSCCVGDNVAWDSGKNACVSV